MELNIKCHGFTVTALRSMTAFDPLPFHIWKVVYASEIELAKPCSTCDGTGEIECDCCDDMTECDECDGTGEIDTAIDQYRRQLARDKDAYDKWIKSIGGDV